MKLQELFEALSQAEFVQKELSFFGEPIHVEIVAGGTKFGKNRDGEEWQREMHNDYGHFCNVLGNDKENLDCYIGDDANIEQCNVYVVHQMTPDGSKFDEDKCFLGFTDQEQALEAFKKHCHNPLKMVGDVSQFSPEHFKQILLDLKEKKPKQVMISNDAFEETYDGDGFFESFGYIPWPEVETLNEAEYQGRTVTLNKPMRGDVKKFKVFVMNPDTGNVIKVNFGDKNMRIKKHIPARRKSFRARHKCDTAKDKTSARYWSCKKW